MKPIRLNAEISKPIELKNLEQSLSESHMLIGTKIIMDISGPKIFRPSACGAPNLRPQQALANTQKL